MKSIILKNAKNYPEIVAYQELNSFGDQIITVEKENLDGSKKIIMRDNFPEGNWIPFTKKELNKRIK